ncbi:MAG: aldo/keto reductase [Phycisphaerales bacterium]|nr:aldo/keto reductase [Phycisphaerales bacterium]
MQKRRFGRTDLMVSPLGFGGAEIGFLDIPETQIATVLNRFLDLGANVIDTAAMYRESERLIGRAIGHRRDEFVLISKCGTPVPDLDEPDFSPALITKTVDRALANLGTDRLDVMLLHSCERDVLERGDALAALVAARDAGKVRFVGYSGDHETAAYAAGLLDVAVIQTSVNICDQRNIDVVLPVCRANDVGVMAKRPIANAAWKDLDTQPGMYSNYAATYTARLKRMGLTPKSCGVDDAWASFALRFTLAQPGVHTAIIGTTNAAHVEGNVRAATAPALDAGVVAKVRASFRVAEAAAEDGPWTGQR